MPRSYVGTLHKLVEAATSSNKRSNWNQLLNYLEGHSVSSSSSNSGPKFDSPLAPYTGPSDDLLRELLEGEDTPLKLSVKNAPSYIIAALCHLGPEAARISDSRGRLPLHHACKFRSTNDKDHEKALKVLVLCHPEGLLHRDEAGRTPLHYLFWYHAKTRSVKLVEQFCMNHDKSAFVGVTQYTDKNDSKPPLPEIPSLLTAPPSAIIICDAKHGALPLHYAVMEGANKEVIKLLLSLYPDSKHAVDRYGRTPLAWYLGAGSLSTQQHISGEAPDPNAPPIYETHISSNIVHLLLSSKVARTTDNMTGRFPFHWAVHLLARHYYHSDRNITSNKECLSLRALQLILDNHFEVLTLQDESGRTPLHILFDVVAEQQEFEWQRLCNNKSVRDKLNLMDGGGPGGFAPPVELIELLLQSPSVASNSAIAIGERPICAAHIEDDQGRLPLHCALYVATEANVVKALIQSHPFGLVHTTEETLQTPLHMLLSSPFATPLQSVETVNVILEAYVTSRHGTFVNGRLALKMEDSTGRYPLHLACENLAALEIVRILLDKYPKAARFQNENGDLPVHSLLETRLFDGEATGGAAMRATLADGSSEWTSGSEESFRQKEMEVLRYKMELLLQPLIHDKESLKIGSFEHGMTPLHIAVAFGVLSYAQLYHMLETYKDALKSTTKVKGHEYTPLDLHEKRRVSAADDENWHMARELLFSFCPLLDTHRRKGELLDRCIRVIRDELEGKGSLHLTALEDVEKSRCPDIQLATTLSSIEAPSIDLAVKPKTPKTPKHKNTANKRARKPPAKSPSSPSKKNQIKSIYDDDLGTGYEASPPGSFDSYDNEEEDDYFSEEDGSDREYDSEDYDSRYDDESMFDDETKKARSQDDSTRQSASYDLSTKQSQSHDMSTGTARTFEDAYENGVVTESKEGNSSAAPLSSTTMEPKREYKLSEVAQRLWIFFVLFNNPSSLEDHYAKQVEKILGGVDISSVTWILNLPLPSYAVDYLEEGSNTAGVTARDVANAYCQASIYQLFYFVGRYEFKVGPNENLLIHRNGDGDTVLLRATEHMATVDVHDKAADTSGDVEEQIWSTGETALESMKPKATFRAETRSVCFKFMRNQQSYESEVECRKVLGIPVEDGKLSEASIIPLISHFSAESDSVSDQRYKRDINDERFRRIKYDSGPTLDDNENSTVLADFPYAVVMHYRDDGDLQDYYYHHGALSLERVRDIGAEIGKSLKAIHDHGLLHGNVSFRGVKSLPSSEYSGGARYWALSDLSCACRQSSASYMAGVSSNGTIHFVTGTFPPEMFVKLSPVELKKYTDYWDYVRSTYKVTIDKAIVEPQFDSSTGEAYVLRCHFMQDTTNGDKLPELPYKLVPVRQAADIWSFGQILFTLCSGGHPVFATNIRTGHLLDYCRIGAWDRSRLEALVYGNVDDPLAQDILLHLLSPYQDRAELNMETVLSHPFFAKDNSAKLEKITKRIMEQRAQECVSHRRSEQEKVSTQAADAWLEERTKLIVCWDLEFQRRLCMSPSELIKREFSNGHHLAEIPGCFIIIPYKLSKNKSGKLTPSTKKDVERAEAMGVKLLALGKACHYASLVEKAVAAKQDSSFRWSSKDLLEALRLPAEFRQLDEEMIRLAATEVERFRDNPMVVAQLIVQDQVKEVAEYFAEARRAFLYLVDENEGVPVIGESNGVYPIEVKDRVADVVQRGLPLMHMSTMYMRGLESGVAGLVKLIFEGAYPLVPPSWAAASTGLTHVLDETEIRRQSRILKDAITDLYGGSSGIDPVQFFQSMLKDCDLKRSFCGLKRVTNGEASLWTSDAGVEKIEALAKQYGIDDALRHKIDADAMIAEQAKKIAEMEKRLEDLEFRQKLNIGDFSSMTVTNGETA